MTIKSISMVEESNIYDVSLQGHDNVRLFHDFKLLRTTANASLYLAYKAGKRFLIKTTKDNSERQNKMLRREYELSIDCDHPHIVHIYTIEDGLPFGVGLVMEYIEGRTLCDFLNENPTKAELERVFEELLFAVAYLHRKGIIHNDLKPENILITRADNTLKLIDFGLADSDAEYAMRTLGCTPRYASPELLVQSREIDARSDIYSIGVIMQQIFGNSAISKRCLSDRPADRYVNIEALQRAWRNRKRPFYAFLSTVLLMAILTPLVFIVNTQIETKQQNKELTRLLEQMDRDISEICNVAKDSITSSRYIEFAAIHTALMQERCNAYRDQIIDQIDIPELEAIFVTRYGQAFEKHWREVVELTANLALSSYHIETPLEHWAFYDSLIHNRLPYRPHPTK